MTTFDRLVTAAGRNEATEEPEVFEIRVGRMIPPAELEALTPEQIEAKREAAITRSFTVRVPSRQRRY